MEQWICHQSHTPWLVGWLVMLVIWISTTLIFPSPSLLRLWLWLTLLLLNTTCVCTLDKHTACIHCMHGPLRVGTQGSPHAWVLNPLLLHTHIYGLVHLACTPWHAVWRWRELWGSWCTHTIKVCEAINRASRIAHHLTTQISYAQDRQNQTCIAKHCTLCSPHCFQTPFLTLDVLTAGKWIYKIESIRLDRKLHNTLKVFRKKKNHSSPSPLVGLELKHFGLEQDQCGSTRVLKLVLLWYVLQGHIPTSGSADRMLHSLVATEQCCRAQNCHTFVTE